MYSIVARKIDHTHENSPANLKIYQFLYSKFLEISYKPPGPKFVVRSIQLISNIGDRFAANISDLSTDEILDMVSQLGDLYDSEFETQSHFRRIDQLLAVFYGGYYSITNVMKRVSEFQVYFIHIRIRIYTPASFLLPFFVSAKFFH